ncbi:MAG: ATP-binding protein [Nitrososphaeraceae archaeon]
MIRNSLDFVPKEGGRTTIRAEEDDTERGHKITFTVEDNGIGIDYCFDIYINSC